MAEQTVLDVALIASNEKFKQVMHHDRAAISKQGMFVLDLVKVGTFSASIPDGYDKRGNQTYRLMTPDELVKRSMETAEKTFAALETTGWVKIGPSFDEMKEDDGGQAGFLVAVDQKLKGAA